MKWLEILVVTVMGLLVGEVVRRWLNTLGYRLGPDEQGATGTVSEDAGRTALSTTEDLDETVLTVPGSRWWIPVALAVAWGCVAWRSPVGWVRSWPDLAGWARFLGWLAFSAIGLGMAVIDLDVRRLPDRGQIAVASVSLVCGVIVCCQNPIRLAYGLGAALVCGLAFLIIHAASRGNLGLGDVKLVMTCGWWLGLTSLTSVYVGLMVSCVLAVAYSLLVRQRQFAFGPWLVTGTLIAGLCLS